MNKVPQWKNDHVEYLEDLNLNKRDIEEIKSDIECCKQTQAPIFEMSQFMRFSWSGVVSMDMKSGWLERTVNPNRSLEDNRQGVLEFYDESDLDSTLESLKNLYDKGINEKDLLKVIRESQKSVLGSVFMMIDGTSDGCNDAALFETEWRDSESVPKRQFYSMEDYFLDYDPIKLNKNTV